MLDLGTLKIGMEIDDSQAKQGLNSISGEMEKTGSKTEGLANKVKGFVKAFAATYAVQQIVKLGKAAVEAYSNYEQLSGGVEKLFGEESSKKVMQYAENAYKTAGVSANKYMELTTSFSASLLQSLGGDTEAAADYADMAIRDMSDNANVFGTSMEQVQNAYQGFAKGNYTMLDNLKLGYGGTKTEMERLLADAEKMSGVEYNIENYDDVIAAIHTIQEAQNITGTTAAEASKTVEGSLNMAKASWENFLTSLGTGNQEQITSSLTNMFSSIGTVAQNLIPVIINIAKGLGMAMLQGLAELPAKLVEWINNLANFFGSNAGTSFTKQVVPMVGKVFKALIKAVPPLLLALIRLLVNVVKNNFSSMITAVSMVFQKIKATVSNIWTSIKKKVGEKLKAVVEFPTIKKFIEKVQSAINWWNDLKQKLSKKAVAHVEQKNSGGIPKRVGLREVPYDGYLAELHKGEAVLTAAETNQYRKWLNTQAQAKATEPSQMMLQAPIDYDRLATTLLNALSGMNINTEVNVSGRTIAQATAPFMKTEINSLERRANRALGVI